MSRRTIVVVLLFAFVVIAGTGVSLWFSGFFGEPSVFVARPGAPIQNVPEIVGGPWGDRPVDKVAPLVGQTLAKVKEQLGVATQEYDFSMGGGLDEFRCELQNTYPPGDPRSFGVRIKEWQWRYPGFSLAIWFHQVNGEWVVLDTCRWKDGVAF
jgi:hypothetical protein